MWTSGKVVGVVLGPDSSDLLLPEGIGSCCWSLASIEVRAYLWLPTDPTLRNIEGEKWKKKGTTLASWF